MTIEEAYENFLLTKKAEGLSEKSIIAYKSHLKCVSHHLDITIPLQHISKRDFESLSQRHSQRKQVDLNLLNTRHFREQELTIQASK